MITSTSTNVLRPNANPAMVAPSAKKSSTNEWIKRTPGRGTSVVNRRKPVFEMVEIHVNKLAAKMVSVTMPPPRSHDDMSAVTTSGAAGGATGTSCTAATPTSDAAAIPANGRHAVETGTNHFWMKPTLSASESVIART